MERIEFEWDTGGEDLTPIYGIGVTMCLDAEGQKVLNFAYIGEPDAFTVYGLLSGAAEDARKEIEEYYDAMAGRDDE